MGTATGGAGGFNTTGGAGGGNYICGGRGGAGGYGGAGAAIFEYSDSGTRGARTS
jgi:hypothetical protein